MSTWIPVEYDDCPKGPVLVWDGCEILVAVCIVKKWVEIATWHQLDSVTHWTTLPEPPKEAA